MFVNIVKRLLNEQSHTQAELATFVGVKPNTVSDWINKGNSPKLEHLYRISEFFGVDFNMLLTGASVPSEQADPSIREFLNIYRELDEAGQDMVRAVSRFAYAHTRRPEPTTKKPETVPFPSQEKEETEQPTRQCTVYYIPASAGTGVFLDSEDYEIMGFPASSIPLDATFGVRISGDSMTPKLQDGDIVFVKQQPYVEENEIGIFVLNGDSYCKQYVKIKGHIYLKSLNPKYDLISLKDHDEVRTVGKVIGIWKA